MKKSMLYVLMNMNYHASIPDTLSPEWVSTEFDATIQNVWMLDGHHIEAQNVLHRAPLSTLAVSWRRYNACVQLIHFLSRKSSIDRDF
jgi:hypothetical protein